ncbi:MAG: V-type ATPase subunit [Spirochaetaceae bacterium]
MINSKFINSKLKAKMSLMLTKEFFNILSRSNSLEEGIQMLRGTDFDILTRNYMLTGDLKMGELELFKKQIKFYTELEPFYPTSFKPLVHALLLKYEIDVLKSVFRLWFDKNIRKRDIGGRLGYIYRNSIINKIPIDEILNCSSLEKIAQLFEDSPYYSLVVLESGNILKYQSLFLFETSLDILYFREIFSAINRLKRENKKIALTYYNYVVDVENIKWANRFREFDVYKDIDFGAIYIPYGLINKQLYKRLLKSEDSEFLEQLKKRYKKININRDEQFPVDKTIYEMELSIQLKIQKLLHGDPFSIGTLIAYFYKKQLEISKIITVLNAISYELSEKRIRELI